MSPATWRPLPLGGPHPPLLTSTRFTSNAYTVHVTDLAHLWTESLERRPIILRALKEDAAIDPSDGEDNMASFLRCIRAAFDPDESMHRRTSISMSPEGEDDLVLSVTCELPKELSSEPLKWNMYLRKQAPEATARELVLPLVESQRLQRERMDGLVDVIRQKDALLSKMLDKLEATGTALEHVFTVLGTRKKVSREHAESKVKGLAPFDRAAWEASQGDGASHDVEALVQGVFGEGVEYTPSAEARHYAEGLGSWWRDVGSVSSGPRDVDDRESTIGKRTAPPSSRESQAKSSPRRSPAKARQPAGDATASETDSEDEAPKRPAPRRLGAIGGAKPRPKTPPLADDEETASESEESKTSAKEAPRESPGKSEPLPVRERSPTGSATASEDGSPARPSPAKRGRAGIGRIGGVGRPRKELSEEEGSDKEVREDEAPARLSPAKRGGIGKIGKIGGVGRPQRQASEEEGSDKEVRSSPAKRGRGGIGKIGGVGRPRREVSEDESDKEVKEEQAKPERKVIARPVKKKRKF